MWFFSFLCVMLACALIGFLFVVDAKGTWTTVSLVCVVPLASFMFMVLAIACWRFDDLLQLLSEG